MPDIKPFLPARPSGIVFIGLNILRVLSIIALLLVFSANIVTISHDVKAIKEWDNYKASHASGNGTSSASGSDDWDCEYVEYSTVPDQAGGPFWSILNRVFILLECLLLTMSEIGIPKRLFEEYLPILGPAHSLGCLGVFQALIGAQVLSHYCELFIQATSWLLFIIGCLNIAAGLVFRSKSKTKRLIFSWENVSNLTPQTRMAATAWDMVSEKRKAPSSSSSSSSSSEASVSRAPSHAASASSKSKRERDDSDLPLVPESVKPGARFGGFGFGRQGEKAAADRGFKISRPLESLPRYAV